MGGEQDRDGRPRCLIPAAAITGRVAALAERISHDYAGRRPLLVGVMHGARTFLGDLLCRLSVRVDCDLVAVSRYGDGTAGNGTPVLSQDLVLPAEGRDLLIIEDIVDRGVTAAWLLDHLRGKGPASIRLCALLDKPARREVPVEIHYKGFTIEDRFVVGYGLDLAGLWRELPYVGYLA